MMTAQKKKSIWNNSLTLVGVLGVAVLLIANTVTFSSGVRLFGHSLAVVSTACLGWFCFIILVKGYRKESVIAMGLGALGLFYGLLMQLENQQWIEKPPIINVATLMVCLGAILNLNKRFDHV